MQNARSISLNGIWQFRFDRDSEWQPLVVPGCWDVLPGKQIDPGPAWYRTTVAIPADWHGQRIWLHFAAVSYHCEVLVNGQLLATHTGLWDAFRIEITSVATPGATATIELQVHKPAGLLNGPASPARPGQFPLKQTLAGFLPYVGGEIFGGIWQDVWLTATDAVMFDDLLISGAPNGTVTITVALSAAATLSIAIVAANHRHIISVSIDCPGNVPTTIKLQIPNPQPWSPNNPTCYTAQLNIQHGEQRSLRFGLRSVSRAGSDLLLNEQPIYPRLALSWGWYAESRHSNPGPEQVRADMLKLKTLGYNGLKLCLWFPPAYYFDLADELGMLLWVELPMWLPEPSAFFQQQTPLEYERLVRQVRQHPAVILYSLGCELNRTVGQAILAPLYTMVAELGGVPVRDNSGSGEAYGGLLDEHADYYDYHFYTELPFLRGLIDYFTPRWRPTQPWLFGEFCDYDTFRDPRPLVAKNTWWASRDPQLNPPGARWQMDLPEHLDRLNAHHQIDNSAHYQQLSLEHGLLHRKYTLELVRSYREIGGYVVTGEVDTPIATAGMLDDQRELKFTPAQFAAFNSDSVLLLGWGRRRAWVAGGDRAAHWDVWSYQAHTAIRAHIVLSHYGSLSQVTHIAWTLSFNNEPPWAHGSTELNLAVAPGTLGELTVLNCTAPMVNAPRRATLQVTAQLGTSAISNHWPLWIFPRVTWPALTLDDPAGRLGDLRQLVPALNQQKTTGSAQRTAVIITTTWNRELDEAVRNGARAVVLQDGRANPGPLPTIECPFWREALRICEPHPAWGAFPHDGWAGLQFFQCATDYALDTTSLDAVRPLLRRLDTRTMQIHDYAVELRWGEGTLIVSSLRLEGGAGEQAAGISRSIANQYLLFGWVQYLAQTVIE
jgi:hypothetical protein